MLSHLNLYLLSFSQSHTDSGCLFGGCLVSIAAEFIKLNLPLGHHDSPDTHVSLQKDHGILLRCYRLFQASFLQHFRKDHRLAAHRYAIR